MADDPTSPKEARRRERLKQGSRAARDVRPARFGQMTKSRPRPPPVLGSIGQGQGTSDEPTVVISRRAVERLDQGHVWVYRSDIAVPETLAGGEIVRLADER